MKRTALWLMLIFSLAAVAQDKAQEPSKSDTTKSQTTTTTTTTTSSTQTSAATNDPSKILPTLDGGLGPCTAEFHITGTDGKPVYNAQVHTLIKHGAFGVKKMDLQLSTNFEGRAKFTGLPDVNKRPTFFDISQGQKKAVRAFDPGANCHPVFDVVLGTEVVVDTGK